MGWGDSPFVTKGNINSNFYMQNQLHQIRIESVKSLFKKQ